MKLRMRYLRGGITELQEKHSKELLKTNNEINHEFEEHEKKINGPTVGENRNVPFYNS